MFIKNIASMMTVSGDQLFGRLFVTIEDKYLLVSLCSHKLFVPECGTPLLSHKALW